MLVDQVLYLRVQSIKYISKYKQGMGNFQQPKILTTTKYLSKIAGFNWESADYEKRVISYHHHVLRAADSGKQQCNV